MSEYIDNLMEAITAMHDCRCSHFGAEHVCEVYGGETVWDGNVEIFELQGHPTAKIAYGWAWDGEEGEPEYIGILKTPPIKTARDALKAAIVSGSFPIQSQ